MSISKYTTPLRYNEVFGKNVVHTANIIPAKAKFAARNAAQHLKNALADLSSKAISIMAVRKTVFRRILTQTGMFSMKTVSEKNPPIKDEIRNLHGLNELPVIAVLALSRR